jgi:glycogen debranching enzyme
VLFTGIAAPERARAVGRGLLRPDFFGGWGIRTVSAQERRYNPMSYHNGSVWPHDNALIALGLGRYGLKDELQRVFGGLMDAATYMEMRRLPELFCGFRRQRGRGPTLYPVACSPQAWAAATPFALLQALLGLEFDPENRELRLRDPALPPTIEWLVIRNLRLDTAELDLAVRRHAGGAVSVEVLRSRETVRVSVVLS